MMARVYIAGPMTGYPDHNYPAFFEAERILEENGFEVVNPARLHGGFDVQSALLMRASNPKTWHEYIRADLREMLTCDAVFTLPGWAASKGAQLEVGIAEQVGMNIIHDFDLFPRGVVCLTRSSEEM
jgi:nucleoside 2-deoxyribosyltransferase